MARKILFIQCANSMFKRHDSCDYYWDAFYNCWEHIGYYMGKHVFEIPKWVAEIAYFLTEDDKELFYCEYDVYEAINKIIGGNYDYVMMSLMNANQFIIRNIVSRCDKLKFIIGGYNDAFMADMADEFDNVEICSDTIEVANRLDVEYRFGTDYSLFEGERVIPRLTMSYGCLNNCKFCIVPHGSITPVDNSVIEQQLRSFEPIDYRLIYIDDKTYGQCANYAYTKEMAKLTGKKDFNGFIVQTTTGILYQKAKEFVDVGVRVAEIGLETYNDQILRKYRKPSSEAMTIKAVDACYNCGLYLIANVIIGLPEETEETYQRTYDYVMPLIESGKLIGINPAIYTDYDNEQNLGEIDFLDDGKTDLHRKWWDKFNNTAADILTTHRNYRSGYYVITNQKVKNEFEKISNELWQEL